MFGGNQSVIDIFSFGRLVLFLALDYPDFMQILFYPIEDQTTLKTVREALDTFEIVRKAKDMLEPYSNNRDMSIDLPYLGLHKCEKVIISRLDLISAGIPEDWFMDYRDIDEMDTLQLEFDVNAYNLHYRRFLCYTNM